MKAMKKILSVCLLLGFTELAFGQSSDCELVLMPVGGIAEDGQFVEASDFLESVYDDAKGHELRANDLPIRGVLCRRDSLLPTMRDLPVLQTGLPLYLSDDFDSNSSGLLTLYDDGLTFKVDYSGAELSLAEKKKLDDTIEIFNFQKSIQ